MTDKSQADKIIQEWAKTLKSGTDDVKIPDWATKPPAK